MGAGAGGLKGLHLPSSRRVARSGEDVLPSLGAWPWFRCWISSTTGRMTSCGSAPLNLPGRSPRVRCFWLSGRLKRMRKGRPLKSLKRPL